MLFESLKQDPLRISNPLYSILVVFFALETFCTFPAWYFCAPAPTRARVFVCGHSYNEVVITFMDNEKEGKDIQKREQFSV